MAYCSSHLQLPAGPLVCYRYRSWSTNFIFLFFKLYLHVPCSLHKISKVPLRWDPGGVDGLRSTQVSMSSPVQTSGQYFLYAALARGGCPVGPPWHSVAVLSVGCWAAFTDYPKHKPTENSMNFTCVLTAACTPILSRLMQCKLEQRQFNVIPTQILVVW